MHMQTTEQLLEKPKKLSEVSLLNHSHIKFILNCISTRNEMLMK